MNNIINPNRQYHLCLYCFRFHQRRLLIFPLNPLTFPLCVQFPIFYVLEQVYRYPNFRRIFSSTLSHVRATLVSYELVFSGYLEPSTRICFYSSGYESCCCSQHDGELSWQALSDGKGNALWYICPFSKTYTSLYSYGHVVHAGKDTSSP